MLNKELVRVFCLIFLITLLTVVFSFRYTIVAAGNGPAYKLNRITGRVWFIAGDSQKLVKEPEKEKSHEWDVVPKQ